MPHVSQYRVYYEDTDAAGIVYYANYLKFAERARTELLRALGIAQSELLEKQGIGFIVRRAEIDFLSPARLDDIIIIETHLQEAGKVRITMQQSIKRGEKLLAKLHVTLAIMTKDGKPTRIPQTLQEVLPSVNEKESLW